MRNPGRAVWSGVVLAVVVTALVAADAAADKVAPSERVQEFVSVRPSPSASGPRIAKLLVGQEAELLGLVPLWYRVRLDDGTEGFVSKAWTVIHPAAVGLLSNTLPGEPRITFLHASSVAEVPKARPAAGKYRIHLIDVGTGLAVLVQGTDFTMLYDAGSKDDKRGFSGSANKSRILAYLYAALGPSGPARCVPAGDVWTASSGQPAQEITIDHVVLSHPHDDHGDLLDEVIHCYHVKNVWDSGRVNDTVFYREFLEAVAAEDGVTYHTASVVPANRKRTVNGTTIQLSDWVQFGETAAQTQPQALGAGASFKILHADAEDHPDPNQNSIVLAVNLGGVKLLLTGDAESGPRKDPPSPLGDIEKYLVETYPADINVDILQVGHHGSRTSSRTGFLQAVSPSLALIGTGPKKYGSVTFPEAAVLEALDAAGTTKILRTDEHDPAKGGCPTADRIGIDDDEPDLPGGCDNWVVEVSP